MADVLGGHDYAVVGDELPAPLRGFTESPAAVPTIDDVVSVRRRHIARSQRNYHRTPMNLVRGRGVWFHDEDGLAYLDSLNNVTHVGHAESRVTAAAARQLRKLNTNSRFVYPQIASYVQKLVATLPDPLEGVFPNGVHDNVLKIKPPMTFRREHVDLYVDVLDEVLSLPELRSAVQA